MRKLILNLAGLGCAGCAAAVQSALRKVEGVRRADVSFEDKKAWVLADDPVSTEELVSAVEQAGYEASPEG